MTPTSRDKIKDDGSLPFPRENCVVRNGWKISLLQCWTVVSCAHKHKKGKVNHNKKWSNPLLHQEGVHFQFGCFFSCCISTTSTSNLRGSREDVAVPPIQKGTLCGPAIARAIGRRPWLVADLDRQERKVRQRPPFITTCTFAFVCLTLQREGKRHVTSLCTKCNAVLPLFCMVATPCEVE